MDIKRWYATGDFFEWNGTQVFYQESGEGLAIFLLHGFPTSGWEYSEIYESLKQNYRVVVPDFVGFGFSSKPKDYAYGFEERVQLIYALAQFLGIAEFHVFARSFSVSTAQELMRWQLEKEAPVKVMSYGLLNGALFLNVTTPPIRQRLILSPLGRWWVKNFGKNFLKDFYRTRSGKYSNIDAEIIDVLFEQILYNDGLSLIPKLNEYLIERKSKFKQWEEAMSMTAAPIQLIWGIDKEDQIGGIKAVHSYRDIVGEQYVVMLKDIGHFPHLECPEKVIEFYTSFLKGIS